MISIFYANNFDNIKSPLDYIPLSYNIGYKDILPRGNKLGNFEFNPDNENDETPVVDAELNKTIDSYLSKAKDYQSMYIAVDNTGTLTLAEIRSVLQNSLVDCKDDECTDEYDDDDYYDDDDEEYYDEEDYDDD